MTELSIKKQVADQERDLGYRKQYEQERANAANERIAKINTAIKAADSINQMRATGSRALKDGAKAISAIAPLVGYNDLSWHSNSSTLLNQRGTLSDELAAGIIPEGYYSFGAGVMALRVAFTPGVITERADYTQSLAYQLYSLVRGDKSGTPPYGVGTPMMYTYAVANAMFILSFAEKVYRVTNRPGEIDTVYGRTAILRALTFSDTQIAQLMINKFALRDAINNFILSLKDFPITDAASLLAYAYATMSMVCREDNTPQSEIYTLVPAGYYVYDWEADRLIFKYVTAWTLQGIYDAMNDIIEHLTDNSVTSRIMYSDMNSSKSKYGRSNGYSLDKLDYLETDAMQSIVYDEEFLNQFRYASVAPGSQWNNMNVEFNDTIQKLVFDPYFTAGLYGEDDPGSGGNVDKMSTFISTQSTMRTEQQSFNPAEAMLFTRWRAIFRLQLNAEADDQAWEVHLRTCANILPMDMIIVSTTGKFSATTGQRIGAEYSSTSRNLLDFSTLLAQNFGGFSVLSSKFVPDLPIFYKMDTSITGTGVSKFKLRSSIGPRNSWIHFPVTSMDSLNYLDLITMLGIGADKSAK